MNISRRMIETLQVGLEKAQLLSEARARLGLGPRSKILGSSHL